jgi:hypothetical protein
MYSIICFESEDLLHISATLSDRLGINFRARESWYRGGLYYYTKLDGTEFFIRNNLDLMDGSKFVEDIPIKCVILCMSSSDDTLGVLKNIKGHLSDIIY